MMYEKKRYTVHILGDEYTIISDETENHIMTSAKQVDDLMADKYLLPAHKKLQYLLHYA